MSSSPQVDLLASLGWRSPQERVLEANVRDGNVKIHLDEEYDTYFDHDVKTELVANKPRKKLDWTRVKKRARYYVPIFMWLPTYSWKSEFPKDIVAGLAVSAMMIPQCLAYSILAGLPPIIGLYTAWMPLIVYFFFGTSKQLSIGPDALGSILVGILLAEEEHEDPVAYAHYLAFLAGLFLLAMGIIRFGFLDNILSPLY